MIALWDRMDLLLVLPNMVEGMDLDNLAPEYKSGMIFRTHRSARQVTFLAQEGRHFCFRQEFQKDKPPSTQKARKNDHAKMVKRTLTF